MEILSFQLLLIETSLPANRDKIPLWLRRNRFSCTAQSASVCVWTASPPSILYLSLSHSEVCDSGRAAAPLPRAIAMRSANSLFPVCNVCGHRRIHYTARAERVSTRAPCFVVFLDNARRGRAHTRRERKFVRESVLFCVRGLSNSVYLANLSASYNFGVKLKMRYDGE